MAGARYRFRGTADDWARALDAALPADIGRTWITYPDKGGVHPGEVAKAHVVLEALHGSQANLSFPRTTVLKGIGILLTMHQLSPAWILTSEHIKPYTELMATRTMMCCRAVAQAELKTVVRVGAGSAMAPGCNTGVLIGANGRGSLAGCRAAARGPGARGTNAGCYTGACGTNAGCLAVRLGTDAPEGLAAARPGAEGAVLWLDGQRPRRRGATHGVLGEAAGAVKHLGLQ